MTSRPRRISLRWLVQRKSRLDCTRKKEDDGSDNPYYVSAKKEYDDAKEELARWETFEQHVKERLKYIVNTFTFRGEPPGTVFIHKQNNKWTMLTFDEAWEKLK